MKQLNLIWWLYILLALMSAICGYHFLLDGKWINTSLFIVLTLIFLALALQFIDSQLSKTEKIILAIRRKDFSLFPKEEGLDVLDNSIKLYYQSKEEHLSLASYKLLYEDILDQLEIGLMILSEEASEWKVFYVNPMFLEILQIPKYNSWQLYEEKIPEFYKIINQTNFTNVQEFFDISIAGQSKQSFSLRTKGIHSPRHRFYIITLESVQKIIEQKEKMAWNNLMKVISHELLNTLTPVNSLIQSLEYIAQQDEIDQEDQEEMKESLMVINSKSQQLLNFVDNYRQVAELPKPIPAPISLKKVTESALFFLKSEFEKHNIQLITNLEDYTVMADEKMIERCLINLYINAIHAVENREQKIITSEIKSTNNRVVLSVADNGMGVPNDIKNKIFLPFFTTRDGGSGIGLTLSRSIMEAHRGYLSYQDLKEGSRFEMWFTK